MANSTGLFLAAVLPLMFGGCDGSAAPKSGTASPRQAQATNSASLVADRKTTATDAAQSAKDRPQRIEGVDLSRSPDEPTLEETYPETKGMPPDVQAYIVRWNDCQHWAGEPDYDDARRRQIREAIEEVCTGLDDLGRRVRARHSDTPAILERIKGLDDLES